MSQRAAKRTGRQRGSRTEADPHFDPIGDFRSNQRRRENPTLQRSAPRIRRLGLRHRQRLRKTRRSSASSRIRISTETQSVIAGSQLLSRSRNSDASRWHVLSEQLSMNCARLRLNAETTTIFVRDGWLIIEAAEIDALQGQLAGAHGDRLLTVAEVGQRTGFTAGAVRDWIKRSVLAAVRVGKEYRVREADLARLLDGKSRETASISKRIDRRRKAISA